MVETLFGRSKVIETQPFMLMQTPLGPFLERHADVVTTSSEEQIENPKESDNEVENSGEKRVEINKIPPTPPEREDVEEVEKEAPYVAPPPYNPPILLPHSFVESKVESRTKKYDVVLENIHTNTLLSKILHKKRKPENHKTRKVIIAKRGKSAFETMDEKIKPKLEKMILRIDPKPPP